MYEGGAFETTGGTKHQYLFNFNTRQGREEKRDPMATVSIKQLSFSSPSFSSLSTASDCASVVTRLQWETSSYSNRIKENGQKKKREGKKKFNWTGDKTIPTVVSVSSFSFLSSSLSFFFIFFFCVTSYVLLIKRNESSSSSSPLFWGLKKLLLTQWWWEAIDETDDVWTQEKPTELVLSLMRERESQRECSWRPSVLFILSLLSSTVELYIWVILGHYS